MKRVLNGGGNYLFLEVAEPQALASRMQMLGIRVRFRPNAAPGGVRLSIGTDAENEAALAAIRSFPWLRWARAVPKIA